MLFHIYLQWKMELREEDFCANTSLYKCLVRCNMYKIIYMFELMLLRYLLVLERKTRGRQLHLAKCFGPKRAFFSCKKGAFVFTW